MSKVKELFANGVKFYTVGRAEVTVAFPERDVSCRWCPFCRIETKELQRYKCYLREQKFIANPDAFGLPDFCPLELDESGSIDL